MQFFLLALSNFRNELWIINFKMRYFFASLIKYQKNIIFLKAKMKQYFQQKFFKRSAVFAFIKLQSADINPPPSPYTLGIILPTGFINILHICIFSTIQRICISLCELFINSKYSKNIVHFHSEIYSLKTLVISIFINYLKCSLDILFLSINL